MENPTTLLIARASKALGLARPASDPEALAGLFQCLRRSDISALLEGMPNAASVNKSLAQMYEATETTRHHAYFVPPQRGMLPAFALRLAALHVERMAVLLALEEPELAAVARRTTLGWATSAPTPLEDAPVPWMEERVGDMLQERCLDDSESPWLALWPAAIAIANLEFVAAHILSPLFAPVVPKGSFEPVFRLWLGGCALSSTSDTSWVVFPVTPPVNGG